MRSAAPILLTLPPSHYCERARWALDHQRVQYTEQPLAVGLHVLRARRLAPHTYLPILVTAHEALQGGHAILDWTQLDGADLELEWRFEHRIGALIRQFLYAATLSRSNSGVRKTLMAGVPRAQRFCGTVLWPVTRALMVRAMQAYPALLTSLTVQVDSELDWFESRLADQSHLVGGRLGRADITAASLLAPLARPQECPIYRQVVLPDAVEASLIRWSQRPSLQWVLKTYATHRTTARSV